MNLTEILKEQDTFNFTGRVNVLNKKTGQFLGVIFQEEGQIINTQFRDIAGKKALLQLAIEDKAPDHEFRYVVEPEIVEDADRRFVMTVDDFLKASQQAYTKSLQAQKLRPPDHLKLGICADFVARGDEISPAEFEVLATMTEYQRVGEIYHHANLLEYEMTSSLVELRKKGALKVIGT